jgi:thymidylate kinase
MNSDRIVFIQELFRFLSKVEYCWLKGIQALPEETPLQSDIDIFIREKDLPAVLFFVAQQQAVMTCKMSQRGEATFLQIAFHDGSNLKLDLLTALVRKQYCYLTEAYILAKRIWKNGVATYTPAVLLEHALLFNYLNNAGLSLKYLKHFKAMPSPEQVKLVAFINGKYGTSFSDIRQMGHFLVSGQNNMEEYLKRQPENSLTARLQRYIRRLQHQFLGKQNLAIPRIITFTGVDGAGKTTLLNDLKTVLSEKLQQRVIVLRHRPSVLPILSAYKHGKQVAEAKSIATLPRQGNNDSAFSSTLRFAYYFADYLFGQIYVWLRYTLPGTTVIYDRYYFDFIVDAKRSNISIGEALPKWLYRFVIKPDLNIFLYAAPEVIRQRKQELPPEDIRRMTGHYRALFMELEGKYSGQYRCIENHDRTATLDTILGHYFSTKSAAANQPKLHTLSRQLSNVLDPC